ncbi:MAG: transcription termination factor Rho, partial [Nitrospirae bacterium CG_4_8_14_3_um_filter_50_41]
MPNTAGGVLKMTSKGGGVLRDPLFSFRKRPNDVAVPSRLIREYGLVEGAAVTG